VAAWLQGKLGRKVRAKIADIELEGTTKEAMAKEEFEQLLHRLIDARSQMDEKEAMSERAPTPPRLDGEPQGVE
jgi:hypothetical protein